LPCFTDYDNTEHDEHAVGSSKANDWEFFGVFWGAAAMHIRIIESARFLVERERRKRRKTSVYLITITSAYLERAEDCDEPIVLSASHLLL